MLKLRQDLAIVYYGFVNLNTLSLWSQTYRANSNKETAQAFDPLQMYPHVKIDNHVSYYGSYMRRRRLRIRASHQIN